MKHPNQIFAAHGCSLHLMIQEACEEYFSELEEVANEANNLEDIETVFEEDLAAIGKMALQVHYGDNYLAFIEALKKEAATNEKE